MNPLKSCPTELLPEFLEDSLNIEKTQDIEQHLASCPNCQTYLEEASGGKPFWSTITNLSDDDLDREWSGEEISAFDSDSDKTRSRETRLRSVFESIKPILSPSDDPQSVGRIGNYEVTGLIGSGGMGVVVKARDKALDRIVAIKLLAPHLAAFESSRLRFQREAKAAAAVKHDGIISIYGVATHRETPYFVMPYEAGPSLQQRIANHGKLSIEESLRVASQIAAALAAAHQSGLVHRDIKPSNILLAPGTERALLTDFGLAQACNEQTLTQTGMLAGTPAFMSPEQARGETVDSRSDLFSLGSVMFAMLTGHPPVVEDTSYAIVRKIGGDPMPQLRDVDPTMPDWLEKLLQKMHQFDSDHRIQTANKVASLVNQCLAHVQNPIENELPATLVEPASNWTRKQVAATALISVAVVIGLLFVAINLGQQRSNSAPNKVVSEKQRETTPPKQIQSSTDTNDETAWSDGLDPMLKDIRSRLETLDQNNY